MTIELKIPRDPALMMAAAVYLQEQARECMRPAEPVIKGVPCSAENVARLENLEYKVPPDALVGPVTQAGDPSSPLGAFDTGWLSAPLGAFDTGWQPLTPAEAFPPVVSPGTEEFEPAISNIHPEVDGRGFPWDKRIHSSSKQLLAKKPNGWKPLRGVDPTLVQTVEAEYIAAGYGQAASTPPPPPPPAPAPAASTSMFAPASSALTFAQVMARIGGANKLKEAQDAFVHFGVTSFPQLGQKPDAWESFLAYLGV